MRRREKGSSAEGKRLITLRGKKKEGFERRVSRPGGGPFLHDRGGGGEIYPSPLNGRDTNMLLIGKFLPCEKGKSSAKKRGHSLSKREPTIPRSGKRPGREEGKDKISPFKEGKKEHPWHREGEGNQERTRNIDLPEKIEGDVSIRPAEKILPDQRRLIS